MKNEKVKTINILGTEYSILTYSDEDFPKEGYDGYCNSLIKEIFLREKGDDRLEKEILRHEIIHGFFHESGLTKYECDEILVEWIAMQFPKIQKVIEQSEKILPTGKAIKIN